MSEPTARASVGSLFRRLRKLAGLNMAEAARKLDVSVPTISCIENDGLGVLPVPTAQRPFVPSEETIERCGAVTYGELDKRAAMSAFDRALASVVFGIAQAARKGGGNG
jgi:transcriptional regulator with XRE-family HTH domain